MKKTSLEERVANLEREFAALKAASKNGQRFPNWQSTLGAFTGDEFMQEVFEEARKYREADRQKAYREHDRKKKGKV